jgi:hypothetical protein
VELLEEDPLLSRRFNPIERVTHHSLHGTAPPEAIDADLLLRSRW